MVVAMAIYYSFNYSTDYTLGFKYLPFLSALFHFDHRLSYLPLYFDPNDGRALTRAPFRASCS